MKKTIKYALRVKGQTGILCLHVTPNTGGDCCNEFSYELCEAGCSDTEYLVDSMEYIIKTLCYEQPWYNSCERHPMRGRYEPQDLEIVVVERQEKIVRAPKIKLPFQIHKPRQMGEKRHSFDLLDFDHKNHIYLIRMHEEYHAMATFKPKMKIMLGNRLGHVIGGFSPRNEREKMDVEEAAKEGYYYLKIWLAEY
jgi:hypothetical protein